MHLKFRAAKSREKINRKVNIEYEAELRGLCAVHGEFQTRATERTIHVK